MLRLPSFIHEYEPLMSVARKGVMSSSPMKAIYIMYANVSKTLSSSISMTKATSMEQPIHISCLPERRAGLKKSGWPYS